MFFSVKSNIHTPNVRPFSFLDKLIPQRQTSKSNLKLKKLINRIKRVFKKKPVNKVIKEVKTRIYEEELKCYWDYIDEDEDYQEKELNKIINDVMELGNDKKYEYDFDKKQINKPRLMNRFLSFFHRFSSLFHNSPKIEKPNAEVTIPLKTYQDLHQLAYVSIEERAAKEGKVVLDLEEYTYLRKSHSRIKSFFTRRKK